MNQPTRTRIVLAGWHGHDNAGDDATLRTFIEQIVGQEERELVVLSELPERVIAEFGSDRVSSTPHYETVGLHGLTHLLKGRLKRHLGLLRQSDMFVLGGGSLLRDNTSWHNLLRVIDEIFWCRVFGKKVVLYAAGIGPLTTRLGRWLVQQTALRSDLITVRDEGSCEQLLALGIERGRINVVADPGFVLAGKPVTDTELLRRVKVPGTVGFFPSLGFIEDGTDLSEVPRIASALDELHEKHGLNFLSMPMRVLPDEIDDVYVTRLVQDKMRFPDALHVYESRLAAEQLKWLTGEFEFNLTIRLHALIFSLANGTPAVAIEYEPKVTNLLHDFALPEMGARMGPELRDNLVSSFERLLDSRLTIREHIQSKLPAIQASSRRCFELIEALLE